MNARNLIAVALLAIAGPFAATAAAESAREKAIRQLNDVGRARGVLLFLHFGSTYSDHNLTGVGGVEGKPGCFYLEYKYDWKVDRNIESTTLSFFFDPMGNLMGIQVDKTTAVLNQPFFLANLSIKVVGATLYEAVKKDLSEANRRIFRKLVEDADAKGLLELILAVDLATQK